MYFFGIIGGHRLRPGLANLSKLTYIMTFEHFSFILIPPKLDMNTFQIEYEFIEAISTF